MSKLKEDIRKHLDEIVELHKDMRRNVVNIAEVKGNYSYKFNPIKWFTDDDGYMDSESCEALVMAAVMCSCGIGAFIVLCKIAFSCSFIFGIGMTLFSILFWGIIYFMGARPNMAYSDKVAIDKCKRNIHNIKNKLKSLEGFKK